MLAAIFFGLVTALLWGVGDFLSRRPSREVGFYLSTAYVQIPSLLIVFAYALTLGPANLELKSSSGVYVLACLAIGILAYFGLLFIFRGYSLGNMAVVAPIGGAYPAVTALLSFLLLGIILVPVQSYAIAVTLAGIILAGARLSELLGIRSRSNSPIDRVSARTRLIVGVDSAVAAALCGGTAFFALGIVTPVLGSVVPLLFIKVVGIGVGFAIIPLVHQSFKRPSKEAIVYLCVVGLLDGLGFITINTGILDAGKDLPIVVTMAALMSMVTSMLASIFYNEKLEKIQMLGIALIIAGVATIVYF